VVKLSVSQTLSKAKSLEKNGEILEASRLYRRVLDIYPSNKRAQLSLAKLNNAYKNINIMTPPQNAINQVVNFYNQGNLVSVIEHSQKLIIQYPKSFIIWNLLGAAYKGLGRIDEAADAFREVVILNPQYAGGYSNLGTTFHEQGRLRDALKVYEKAIALQPDYAEAYSNMGNTFKELGKFKDAIESYNKALLI
jgi:protein O-GlcNAc transferase